MSDTKKLLWDALGYPDPKDYPDSYNKKSTRKLAEEAGTAIRDLNNMLEVCKHFVEKPDRNIDAPRVARLSDVSET